jgi:hypothetical protein
VADLDGTGASQRRDLGGTEALAPIIRTLKLKKEEE